VAGFRLKTYHLRGWNAFLEEPLRLNRMSKKTLDAMWSAVEAKVPVLTQFLTCKAQAAGVPKLKWEDVEVPVTCSTGQNISYEEAQKFIVEHFARFSSRMASYAKKAFNERAIECEDRSGKRPGGFCTSFPLSKKSRIFMTWSNTRENLTTLAHELGHGFHSEMVFDLPPLAMNYPMTLAETASTFAEQIISEGLLNHAKDSTERLSIIEERAIRSVLFLMNIRCRFLFEKRFYELRPQGLVNAEKLSEIMLEAQKTAFGNALESYHPLFWASKQHFFLSEFPFYNFPYAFGYLFSLGLYSMAKEQGFDDKYCALLRDTGRMSVEDVAKSHLGVDLTQSSFWNKAVDLAIADAKLFVGSIIKSV